MNTNKTWDQMSDLEKIALYDQQQEPASQVLSSSDEGEEVEGGEAPVSPVTAGKRPFNPQIWPVLEEDEGDLEMMDHHRKFQNEFRMSLRCFEEYEMEPDLGEYLGSFGLSDFQQISLCRTWANYLTQRDKAKKAKLNNKTKK